MQEEEHRREVERHQRELKELQRQAEEEAAKAREKEETQNTFAVISDLDNALKAFTGALGLSDVSEGLPYNS